MAASYDAKSKRKGFWSYGGGVYHFIVGTTFIFHQSAAAGSFPIEILFYRFLFGVFCPVASYAPKCSIAASER